MSLPWFAVVLLGAAALIAAAVWVLGARLRVGRGEELLPGLRTMAVRGAVTPVALSFMAADFATTAGTWAVWLGLVFGTWLATLLAVRATLRAIFVEHAAAAPAAQHAPAPRPHTATARRAAQA